MVSGLIYRLFLTRFAPNDLIWDINTYHGYALDFMSGKMIINCCEKNVGYGLVLGLIYSLFGTGNLFMVQLVQSVLDLVTAYIVFILTKEKFGRKTGLISFIIYLFNPFTAAYAGLRLAETFTLFNITFLAYLITRQYFKSSISFRFIFGLVLGLLLFTRIQFYYFTFLLILVSVVKTPGWGGKILVTVATVVGFLVVMSYTLIGNYQAFKTVSLIPPHNWSNFFWYLNFYNDRYPELVSDWDKMNPEYNRVAFGYRQLTGDWEKMEEYKKEYFRLFLKKLATVPHVFFGNSVRNMIWMWDKYFLFPYKDPLYPRFTPVIRTLNIILISLFFVGIFSYGDKKRWKDALFIISVILFFYTTVIFSVATNETRHTIFYYSFICLWAGYGVTILFDTYNTIRRK